MAPESPYTEHIRRANAAFLECLANLPTPTTTGDQDRAERWAELAEVEALEARRLREGG